MSWNVGSRIIVSAAAGGGGHGLKMELSWAERTSSSSCNIARESTSASGNYTALFWDFLNDRALFWDISTSPSRTCMTILFSI
jgi:acetyl/propionyl-CoA carboxylase alpha subunit